MLGRRKEGVYFFFSVVDQQSTPVNLVESDERLAQL